MLLARFVFYLLLSVALIKAASAQNSPATVSFLEPGSQTRSGGSEIRVNPRVIDSIQSSTSSLTLTDVPLVTGGSASFDLKPIQVLARHVEVIRRDSNGTTRSLGKPDIPVVWSGADPDRPGTLMVVSADEQSQIQAMVIGDQRTSVTVIAPDPDNPIAYRIMPTALPDLPFCEGTRLMPSSAYLPQEGRGVRAVEPGQIAEVELALDLTGDLVTVWGGQADTAVTYVVNLISAVNAIYRRDLMTTFRVSHVTVHEGNPFAIDTDSNGFTSGDQLNNYFNYIRNTPPAAADLYHLLDVQNLGGVAYVDALRSTSAAYRTGVSNVNGRLTFPGDVNTYFWDTLVVAHELGHNVGSPHTHCYNPPIDCCVTECRARCPSSRPQVGTIMSYCHSVSGGSIDMHFHPRVIQTVRPKIETSPLVSAHVPAPHIIVRGVNDFVIGADGPERSNVLESGEVGGPPVIQQFTIENIGTAPLEITGPVRVVGSPQLTLFSQPQATIVHPNQSTSFNISYNPVVGNFVMADVIVPINSVAGAEDFTFMVGGIVVIPSDPIENTFSEPRELPDRTQTLIDIPVSGVPGWITDVRVRFNGTDCDNLGGTPGLSHPRIGDLQMVLLSPHRTQVRLMANPGIGRYGVSAPNLCGTILTDSAPVEFDNVQSTQAPFAGEFRPLEPLSRFAGENPNGVWTLVIIDTVSQNAGQLNSVSLLVSGMVDAGVADWSVY